MQVIAVIHHSPSACATAATGRSALGDQVSAALAGLYDGAYGQAGRRYGVTTDFGAIALVDWPDLRFDWPSWTHPGAAGDVTWPVLATVGYPMLEAPPGQSSSVVEPGGLAGMLAPGGAVGRLAFVGGYYAAAWSDGQIIRLATNYLGEVPLYRASHEGVTVWSNKAAAAAMLAGLPLAIDDEAAAQMVMMSHTLDGRTLIRGVTAEPPATCLTLDARGVAREAYMDLPGDYFAHRMSGDDIAQSVINGIAPLAERLRESDEPSRLHLSGGLDSRAVGALLRRYGFTPLAVTHNTPNEEEPAAKQLASTLELMHRSVRGEEPDVEAFESHVDAALWRTDGLMSLKYLGGRFDLLLPRDEKYHPIEGLGGEYGRAYYFGYAKPYAIIERGHFSPVFAKALGAAEAHWHDQALVQATRRGIRAYLDAARDAGLNSFQASTWYYVNQKMRHWATVRRNAGWQWVIDPLQMPCYTLAGMSAAPADQTEDRLIRGLIARAWPAAADVPTVPELALRARRRRVASNRVMRSLMSVYDRLVGPGRGTFKSRTLESHHSRFLEQIEQAQPGMAQIVPTAQARHWLAQRPWDFARTELFWQTLTLARWVLLTSRRPAMASVHEMQRSTATAGRAHEPSRG